MNHQVETIDFGAVELTVALDAGPRILGYARYDGPQLFAALSGEVIQSATGTFAFLGGHRLWRAPEVPAITYEPDDRPVVIEQTDSCLRVTGPRGIEGLTKIIELRQQGDMTVADHTLRNDGSSEMHCAAWAITQLVPGGVAILPQPLDLVDGTGVLPNRTIVLWPYTDPAAPEIDLQRSELRIGASASNKPAKLGQPNRRGWMAYVVGDELFVKWSRLHEDGADYADLGASIQCYRDHRFLELETLSPLVELAPGDTLRHRELWTLIDLSNRSAEEVLASLPEQPAEMID